MIRLLLTRRGLVLITLCGGWCSMALGVMATADHHHPPNPPASIQTTNQQAAPSASSSSGTITGRVVNDEGQPLPYVEVYAISTGERPVVQGRSRTDGQGRFQFTGLLAGSYLFNANVPGYVSSQLIASRGSERVYYQLGETVTLQMIKGGVITGCVTDASGEPITGLPVRVWRVNDTDGIPLLPSGLIIDGQTDDRGIYRIYGLLPGSYLVGTINQANHVSVVVAGTSNQSSGRSWDLSPRVGQAPTFHPSSTSDTAAEVTVRSGEEASGIDIRFRGERGYAVSGAIVNAATSNLTPVGTPTQAFIILYNLATRAPETMTPIGSGKYSFALYGVPDGEYEMVVTGAMSNEDASTTFLPHRVSVKRADVTGIELKLIPLSFISGRLVLERDEARSGCEIKPPFRLDETTLAARLAEKESREASFSYWQQMTAKGVPDSKGEFTLRNLTPARYRLETNLPSEHWYVKSITAPDPAAVKQTLDAGRQGLALKIGERAKGLLVTIAEGAASLRGRAMPAAEGAKLPARLRVYLIPAEQSAAEDVLRYAQTTVRSDGSFTLLNLAPGKYWLLARALTDDELFDGTERPMIWDNAERAKLRREAEAGKIEIELQPCQRVNDYALRYRAAATGK